MSVASAKAFLKVVADDASLRTKIEAADDSGRQAIAKDLGFIFDKSDVKAALGVSGELSEAELEAVAGGGTADWIGATASVTGAAAAAI